MAKKKASRPAPGGRTGGSNNILATMDLCWSGAGRSGLAACLKPQKLVQHGSSGLDPTRGVSSLIFFALCSASGCLLLLGGGEGLGLARGDVISRSDVKRSGMLRQSESRTCVMA